MTDPAELLQATFCLVDGIDPRLGLGIASLEGILEWLEPRVNAQHTCMFCISFLTPNWQVPGFPKRNWGLERLDVPVPSLGMPLLATVPPLASELEELSEMSFMLTAAANSPVGVFVVLGVEEDRRTSRNQSRRVEVKRWVLSDWGMG